MKISDGVYHPVHHLNDTLMNIYQDEFRSSEEFAEFRRRTGRPSISFSQFAKGATRCKCIQTPTQRYCVDEIETEFGELVTAMHNVLKTSREQCQCNFCANERNNKRLFGKSEYLVCDV